MLLPQHMPECHSSVILHNASLPQLPELPSAFATAKEKSAEGLVAAPGYAFTCRAVPCCAQHRTARRHRAVPPCAALLPQGQRRHALHVRCVGEHVHGLHVLQLVRPLAAALGQAAGRAGRWGDGGMHVRRRALQRALPDGWPLASRGDSSSFSS